MSAMAHGIPLIVDSARRDLASVVAWGRQKMQEGAYEAAIQHFTAALDLKPGMMHALVARGDCHLKLGHEEQAQQDFAEVIKKDAGFSRNIYVMIARCCKRSGEYHQAIRYLTRCIGHFATFRPALLERGELSLKVHDYEKARVDFKQVLSACPSDMLARRGLGDALRGLGNFREALRQYSRAAEDAGALVAELQASEAGSEERRPTDEEYLDERLEEDYADGGYDDLDANLGDEAYARAADGGDEQFRSSSEEHRSCESDQTRPPGDSGEGLTAQASEQRSVWLQNPERLKEFFAETLLRRALLLRLMGDLEAAGENLLEILQMDLGQGLALFWYGKVLLEQGRHQEAPGFLQASLQQSEGTRAHARALLGALCLSWSSPDCDAALRNLREASRLDPGSSAIKVTYLIACAMGALRTSPRDPEGALAQLDKALHILTASSGLAEKPSGGQTPRLHVAGSGGAAVTALALTAREKCPEETRWRATKVLVKRREALAQGGDLELALECQSYLQLVAQDPQQRLAEVPFLLYMLRTLALCELCRWEEAVANCRKALQINPEDDTAQYTLNIAGGILRAKCGKHEAAVACFAKAIRLRPVSAEARIHRAIALARAARAACPGSQGSGPPNARAAQLLEEAVEDLIAVENQAQITGNGASLGASHLRAACLCSLGRPEEAQDVLAHCRLMLNQASPEAAARQGALEAEVLMLLGRYLEAVQVCSQLVAATPSSSPLHVEARLMRGCCYSELRSVDRAFEDYREAVVLAPDRSDVHEASGELFLLHSCFSEAATAFGTAARLADALSPRIMYKRALALLAVGNVAGCAKDMSKALRVNPNMPVASRARDGVSALQAAMSGDFRHAHVRFNVLLHSRPPRSPVNERLPTLFLPHEIAVYRGLCSLYLGELAAAIQDFAAAVELAQQALLAGQSEAMSDAEAPPMWSSCRSREAAGEAAVPRLPPEIASQRGLDRFACEAQYNIALCQLMAGQYGPALTTCWRLLDCHDAMKDLGPKASCLAWFLIGICNLATGDMSNEAAREAFTASYADDPRYVDDFLRRHGRRHEPSVGMSRDLMHRGVTPVEPASRGCPLPPVLRRVGAPYRPVRQLGGGGSSPRPPGAAVPGVCDACEEAICCLRPEKSRFSTKLQPLRVQVRDVVVWARPCVGWPAVCPAGPAPPAGLARLDLLHQQDGLQGLSGPTATVGAAAGL